jgi:FkbM family methyltransferase
VSYAHLLEVRDLEVYGVKPWLWIKTDRGAWGNVADGPAYEFEGLRKKITSHTRANRVIVQAGGCLGMYPRLWRDHFERVYTFEPDPLNFQCLVSNCQDDNIIKFNCALGAGGGLLHLNRMDAGNVGMNTVSPGASEGLLLVPQMRIDDLHLEVCDAIQLDVEGFEGAVIAGATDTIMKCRPVISVETCGREIVQTLSNLGYVDRGRSGPDTVWAPA